MRVNMHKGLVRRKRCAVAAVAVVVVEAINCNECDGFRVGQDEAIGR